jgi:hypothetical protein
MTAAGAAVYGTVTAMSGRKYQRVFLRKMIRITSTTTPQAIKISSQDMVATPVTV